MIRAAEAQREQIGVRRRTAYLRMQESSQ